jgi:hypothetical protein
MEGGLHLRIPVRPCRVAQAPPGLKAGGRAVVLRGARRGAAAILIGWVVLPQGRRPARGGEHQTVLVNRSGKRGGRSRIVDEDRHRATLSLRRKSFVKERPIRPDPSLGQGHGASQAHAGHEA